MRSPMPRIRSALIVAAGLLAAESREALAQQITVQQPVVEMFQVGTTVSVPDSGRAYAGGARRAARARARSGPFPLTTSTGIVGQGSSVAANVSIQDFNELDRRALGTADRHRGRRDDAALSPDAERAYRLLSSRGRADATPIGAASETGARNAQRPAATREAPAESGPGTDDFLRHARRAEAEGKRSLALSHFRAAARRGSAEAEAAIERLNGVASARQ